MPSSQNVKMTPEGLRSLAFGSISTSYAPIGSALAHPIILLHIMNDTDADMYISFFDDEDHLFVKAGGFVLYDVAANKADPGGNRVFSKGLIISGRQVSAAPTSGSIYLIAFYGAN